MQPKPRQVHIRCGAGSIKPRENVTQLYRRFSNHVTRVVVFVKAIQTFLAN